MLEYEYINNNDDFKNNNYLNYFSKFSQIKEQANKSMSNLSKLEKDISSLINFLRKNPLEFCNNLIQKNKHRSNKEQNEIINFLQEIHSKKVLKPLVVIPELSLAARSLLNKIIIYYKNNHSLSMKELEPNRKNLRIRLSKYGERTGKIFETVLFELNNPEEIVNHILLEEKGRNMLLSSEMKFIGISCDLIDSNLMCTIIDIVQDFIPFKSTNNINNINNNINNNIYMMYNNNNENSNYNFNKGNYGKLKQNFYYNQNNLYANSNTEYISLIENLSDKNKKDNLKLKILPRKKTSDLPMNIRMDINLNDNYNMTNNNIQINLNEGKNIYYKTPKKFQFLDNKNNSEYFSPKFEQNKNINFKKAMPKRMNSSNINILTKDLNEENKTDINDIKDVKFTMAGRTNVQQQNIVEISKKNLNKSKSVCSFDVMSVNSKNNGKNKYQRLNHEEKMEILHKINNRNMKTTHSKSPCDKNSENINFNQKKEVYENNNKKSPSRISYNQEYFDIHSETEKNNIYVNNNNEFINKFTKDLQSNNYDNENNPSSVDVRSFQGEIEMNNEEYSRKKINEIKNDIKKQLKEELKKDVIEEVRNEFNKQLLYEKTQNKKSNYFALDKNVKNSNKINQNTEYQDNKKIESKNNNYELNKVENKNNNINNKIYYNKNKNKGRWSSVEKYYYNKNDTQKKDSKNNNINNNVYIPKSPIRQKNKGIYYKGRKSFDWREFVSKNKNDDGILLKQKYQERYTKSNYPSNHIYTNNNFDDNFSENTNRGHYINNQNIKNENMPCLNQIYRQKSKKEIKKLIKLYNMAQDDKRNKNVNMDNSSSYNIINNNKSVNDCLINDNEIISDIMKVDIDDKKSTFSNIENTKEENSQTKNNQPLIKNIIKTNHNRNTKKLEEKTKNSNENFVEGHRFQIKYEKVKSKSQMYKNVIPKKRNFSMNKINIDIDENIINKTNTNNKSFIAENNSQRNSYVTKNEDLVNIENSDMSNQNKIINEKNDEEQTNKYNELLMKTGRFVDIDLSNSNEAMGEIKKLMDENIYYKESSEKPIISKTEKIEGNSVITTIITRTKKIYTPDKENPGQNKKKILQKNGKKKQGNKIKNNINMDKINNFQYGFKEAKSLNSQKNNSIKTKNISLIFSSSNKNYSCKTPNQKQMNTNDNNCVHEFNLYSGNTYNSNENLEKKYIKDPEGNLIETFVKKTKYKNGSILLEYV